MSQMLVSYMLLNQFSHGDRATNCTYVSQRADLLWLILRNDFNKTATPPPTPNPMPPSTNYPGFYPHNQVYRVIGLNETLMGSKCMSQSWCWHETGITCSGNADGTAGEPDASPHPMRPFLRAWASTYAAVAPATASAAIVRGLPSETRGRRGAEPEPESAGEGGAAVEGSKNF